jgi:hypothetical protein
MNRFGTFARNRQNGFVALRNCFVRAIGDDIFARRKMVFSELAHIPRLALAGRRRRRWRALTRGLCGGPAGIGRTLQVGGAGHAALPELSGTLLRQGRLSRLLIPLSRKLLGG